MVRRPPSVVHCSVSVSLSQSQSVSVCLGHPRSTSVVLSVVLCRHPPSSVVVRRSDFVHSFVRRRGARSGARSGVLQDEGGVAAPGQGGSHKGKKELAKQETRYNKQSPPHITQTHHEIKQWIKTKDLRESSRGSRIGCEKDDKTLENEVPDTGKTEDKEASKVHMRMLMVLVSAKD